MASQVAVMRNGCIEQVGTPRAVYDRPESLFVAWFVGSPGMNLINGLIVVHDGRMALEAGGSLLSLDHYAWRAPPTEGRPAILGVRLEDVGIAGYGVGFTATLAPILVEPTGSDTLLRLRFEGAEITARVHRDQDVAVGRLAIFAFDLSKASVFCPETGVRL